MRRPTLNEVGIIPSGLNKKGESELRELGMFIALCFLNPRAGEMGQNVNYESKRT